MLAIEKAIALYPNSEQEFFYLGAQSQAIACWQHSPRAQHTFSQAVVLCPPFGHEYTHSHRTFKHLAGHLASQGFTVFRFDYCATGDSSGSAFDDNCVQTWIDNICLLTRHAQASFPQITLMGFRLGASLAALAAQKMEISQLVLWEPVIKGKSFVRELNAIARLSGDPTDKPRGWIECAGFLMTNATQKAISEIDLTQQIIHTTDAVLLIGRDDRNYDTLLKDILKFSHTYISEVYLSGYLEMLNEPHATKVPFESLNHIIQWLLAQSADQLLRPSTQAAPRLKKLELDYQGQLLEEQACWYQADPFLFGIVTRLKNDAHLENPSAKKLPTIILLNSGSVHHVGPNRIYVEIARSLATLGFCVLRLDLEGLGDSLCSLPELENHPYQPNTIDNVFTAISYFKKNQLGSEFIIGGICSGAYSAFHIALADIQKKTASVRSIFLINPLTFYWHEGMSLAIPQAHITTAQDKNYYKKSIRDFNKWKKLLSGKTSLKGIARFIANFLWLRLNIYIADIKEFLFESTDPLTQDFNRLINQKIPINFIFSEDDPGLCLIEKCAYKSFKRAQKKGLFHLTTIQKADHTFSKQAVRDDLLNTMKHIFSQLKQESGSL